MEIGIRRLDDIAECPLIDYAKLNIQGADLMILENGLEKFSQAVVIETEVEFVEVYRRQPLFGDILKFLSSQGFVLHKLVDIYERNFRPLSTHDPTDVMSHSVGRMRSPSAIFLDWTCVRCHNSWRRP